MIVKGKVVRLESYGAFVDIGAERPGLVHVSEISHNYVRNPADVLKEGQEVEVKVLEANRRKRQIRLSIKAAQAEATTNEPMEEKAVAQKRKGQSNQTAEEPTESEVPERELTALEIAYREALARANGKQNSEEKERKKKTTQTVNEEIFERTLKSSGISA